MISVDELPPALTTEQAAELFGCTPDHLWRLVREERAPVPVLRLGRMLRWPRQPILEALGLGPDATNGGSDNPPSPSPTPGAHPDDHNDVTPD